MREFIHQNLLFFWLVITLVIIEAWRIKTIYGKVKNINHTVSFLLSAVFASAAAIIFTWEYRHQFPLWALRYVLMGLCFYSLRLALYDPLLNFARILTKTNPEMRLDYSSDGTNAYTDGHTNHVSFWWKRAIGLFSWAAFVFIYYLIFIR